VLDFSGRRDMATTTYPVTGMTCEHCVHAVTAELAAVDGVTTVAVDLVPGGESLVTVNSEVPLPGQAVAAALDEAGDYRLASA
jgi:copper chaperone